MAPALLEDADALDALLRRTFAAAKAAESRGEAPFAALLAAPDGAVLLQHANAVEATGDPTDHAEAGLIRRASTALGQDALKGSVLVASSEPCTMCCAAAFWAGWCEAIVYGCPAAHIGELAALPGFCDNEHPLAGGAPPPGSARAVFSGPNAAGVERVVVGPRLEEEAKAVHATYWFPTAS